MLWLHAVIGLVLGSFGSLIVGRVPKAESIGGRSHCPQCHATLGPIDLVPVLSFLALRGRCRRCKAAISWRYPLLELASAGIFVGVFWVWPLPLPASMLLGVCLWLLLLIAVIDAEYQGIPDVLNIALLVCAVALCFVPSNFILAPIEFGAVVLPVAFFSAQWLLSHGRWVGSGDIILGAGIGALMRTWWLTFAALAFAYIIGAVVASVLMLTGKKSRSDHIAFGPFLAIGTVAALLLEDIIRGILLF